MSAPEYLNQLVRNAARSLFNRMARRDKPNRPRRRAVLESLESRVFLSASVTINAANQLAFLGDPGNDDVTVSFAPNASGGTYTINDSTAAIDVASNNGPGLTTAGNGTHTVTVTNLSSLAGASLSFDGNGNAGFAPGDTFNIQSSNDPISVDQTGSAAVHDTFHIGNTADGVQGILAPVSLRDTSGAADVTIDDSADASDRAYTLAGGASVSTISHLAPGLITLANGQISSLTVDGGNGNDFFTVDFSGGNPIPTVSMPGLMYSGGGGADNVLNLVGTPPAGQFASVVPKATGRGSGSISFVDQQNASTELTYVDLTPITDTTPAVDYTFNDFGYPDQSFSATDGPIIGGFQTIQFTNTPTPSSPLNFETTDIANKNFVTFNTPPQTPGVAGVGIIATVNVPVASDGLLSLTFNTPTGGDNVVTFVNTPPGIVTSLNNNGASSVTNVTGLGVASGTVLFLNGGPGANVLNYDGGGETPTVTPGLLPGEILVSIPGAGFVDALNYTQINITDVSPLTITPGPAVTIIGVAGSQIVDTVVGTFAAPSSILPLQGGLPAGDFTASIDWGDGSVAAGIITQDASNTSVYSIASTHTFAENGTFTIANSVASPGGAYTTPVNGVPISLTFGTVSPTAGTSATAFVSPSPLTGTAGNVITGVEGNSTGTVLLGTFVDADQNATVASYTSGGGSVVVNWGDGSSPQTLSASNVAAIGTADGLTWTINAAHTYTAEGTYACTVTVANADGAATIISGSAVVADAQLTPGSPVSQNGNTGILLSGNQVGSFSDDNTFAVSTDFTGTIDWGDGSGESQGVIQATATPGVFDVNGTHNYANPGVYNVSTTVRDEGGTTTIASGTFTITDLPVTGQTKSFTAVEGQNISQFVLATFEDPNTLATVSDVKAQLAIGGWGDGTPTVAGTQLVVQQTGVDPSNGDPTFEVLGTHTYAQDTPPGLPDTLSVIITTAGGDSTTLTSPPGGGVTILDAPLTGSAGNAITGIAGNSTGTVLLGAFVDANPKATVADYTSGSGSVVVNWGDGSAPQTLAADKLTAIGNSDGATWTINAGHTYLAGTYAYTVTVTDDGGAETIVAGSAVIGNAALTVGSAIPLTPSTGILLSNSAVAGFNDGNPDATIANFTATIDWGDGSAQSTGIITQPGGVGTVFFVRGEHTYANSGDYTTLVTATDAAGAKVVMTGSATVTDSPITGSADDISSTASVSTGNVVLATIDNPNLLATTSSMSAVLTSWGDGVLASPVTLPINLVGGTATNTVFQVTGSHLYTDAGNHTFSISVTTAGGQSLVLTGSANIVAAADPPTNIVAAPVATPIDTIHPGSSTGTIALATFTDSAAEAVGHYTATITWGDGNTSAGAVTLSNGVFTVDGSNTYASTGNYSPIVSIQKDALTPQSVTDTGRVDVVSVANVLPLTAHIATDTGITFSGVEGRTVNATVANFTSVNTSIPAADFKATINWGDGKASTAGKVVATGGGNFHIVGTHVYRRDASYPVTVTLKNVFSEKAIINSTATITDAALELPAGKSPTVAHGSTFANLLLGTFRDDDATNTSAAEYVGTIDWGDGSNTSAAKFAFASAKANLGSNWKVKGTHKYTNAGTFTVTISIHDVDSPGNVILITTTIEAT